jgi:oligopeptide transport system ATP-binding protein
MSGQHLIAQDLIAQEQTAQELIAVEHAAVHFPVRRGLFGHKAHVRAVDDVSLTLRENETVALVGESGSGKTTLGLAILGLRALSAGVIRWRGQSLADIRRRDQKAFRRDVQAVFQDPYASLNPRLQISEALRRPLALHAMVKPSELRAESERLLELVGLAPAHLYLDRYPHEFSGGQRQRIAIARALALSPSLLVADEPVSALDVSIRTQILKLLQTLKRELKLAMLFLSHDLGVVRFIADRVVVMYIGKIVETAPVATLFERPLHPYTRLLLSAAPSARKGAPEHAIEVIGDPPSPTNPPSGCRFRTRCPFAFDRCAVEEPPLYEAGPDHRHACHLVAGRGPIAAPTS